MRLLRRLLLALCVVILATLAVAETVTVRQELGQLERSVRADLRYLGRVLVSNTRHHWQEDGEAAALHQLEEIARETAERRIRWLPNDTRPERDRDSIQLVFPLSVDGVRQGAIQLSQSRAPLHDYAIRRIRQVALLEGALFLASLGVIYGLGRRLVGARLERLVEQARRIGSGDLETRVDALGRDEIAVLGRQMNAMADQLLASRVALENAEAERMQALAQLRHSDRLASIGRLSSVLAHELGTPLNVVLARAKLIAERPEETGEVVKNAEIVHGQAQRMTEAIRATLGLARRGSALARIDLREVARDALRLLEPLARRKGVKLALQPGEGTAPVEGRRGEIEQVVANLVNNALDAVERGGSIEVEIASVPAPPGRQRAGLYQRLSVRDDGPGISEEVLPRIFEAFSTTKPEGQGTGLGLWIVEGIVRDHGGWVDVESRPGAGSCLRVYLPARPAA